MIYLYHIEITKEELRSLGVLENESELDDYIEIPEYIRINNTHKLTFIDKVKKIFNIKKS